MCTSTETGSERAGDHKGQRNREKVTRAVEWRTLYIQHSFRCFHRSFFDNESPIHSHEVDILFTDIRARNNAVAFPKVDKHLIVGCAIAPPTVFLYFNVTTQKEQS